MDNRNNAIKEMIGLTKHMSQLTTQALDNALADYPGNHFSFLERLYVIIEDYGTHGSISASVLAQDLGIAPSALSRELRGLEADGVILRRLDPKDRRRTLISITEKGETERVICEKAVSSYFDSIARIIGPETMHEMCRIHKILGAALYQRNLEWHSERKKAQSSMSEKE